MSHVIVIVCDKFNFNLDSISHTINTFTIMCCFNIKIIQIRLENVYVG